MGLLPTHLLHNPQKMLSMISQRQECISDNIANMHTKGYRRKDVDFSQYLNNGVSSRLETSLIEKYGPNLKIEFEVVNPTAGSHCGPDTVGVAFYAKHK